MGKNRPEALMAELSRLDVEDQRAALQAQIQEIDGRAALQQLEALAAEGESWADKEAAWRRQRKKEDQIRADVAALLAYKPPTPRMSEAELAAALDNLDRVPLTPPPGLAPASW